MDEWKMWKCERLKCSSCQWEDLKINNVSRKYFKPPVS